MAGGGVQKIQTGLQKWSSYFQQVIIFYPATYCSLFQQSSTTSEALRGCTSYVVGNGLLFMFPRLYKVSSAPTATISKMRSWVNDNWVRNVNWRRTPRIFEIEQEMSLHRVLQQVQLHNTKSDLKVWNLCTDGKFTVQSCNFMLFLNLILLFFVILYFCLCFLG